MSDDCTRSSKTTLSGRIRACIGAENVEITDAVLMAWASQVARLERAADEPRACPDCAHREAYWAQFDHVPKGDAVPPPVEQPPSAFTGVSMTVLEWPELESGERRVAMSDSENALLRDWILRALDCIKRCGLHEPEDDQASDSLYALVANEPGGPLRDPDPIYGLLQDIRSICYGSTVWVQVEELLEPILGKPKCDGQSCEHCEPEYGCKRAAVPPTDAPYLHDRANGVQGVHCVARQRKDGVTEYWTGKEWAAFCGDLYFDLRPQTKNAPRLGGASSTGSTTEIAEAIPHETNAAPVAYRKFRDPQYDYSDRYRYRDAGSYGAPEGWEPLYTARAVTACADCGRADGTHASNCEF